LMLPFCKPTAYGLGKSGWVSASFPENKVPSVEMLKQWIDESYRAQAPKKFLKQLDQVQAGAGASAARVTTKQKSAPPDTRAVRSALRSQARSRVKNSGALATKVKKPAKKRVS